MRSLHVMKSGILNKAKDFCGDFSGETLGSNWEFDFETDVLSRFLGLAVSSEGKVRVFSGEILKVKL